MTDLTPEREQRIRHRPHKHTMSANAPCDLCDLLAALDAERARADVHKGTLADLRRQMEELRAEGKWPVAKVVAERDAALARVADLEAVAEAARGVSRFASDGWPELHAALACLDANKDTE